LEIQLDKQLKPVRAAVSLDLSLSDIQVHHLSASSLNSDVFINLTSSYTDAG
jgi:hypothetical protein